MRKNQAEGARRYANRIAAGERPEDVLVGVKKDGALWNKVMEEIHRLKEEMARVPSAPASKPLAGPEPEPTPPSTMPSEPLPSAPATPTSAPTTPPTTAPESSPFSTPTDSSLPPTPPATTVPPGSAVPPPLPSGAPPAPPVIAVPPPLPSAVPPPLPAATSAVPPPLPSAVPPPLPAATGAVAGTAAKAVTTAGPAAAAVPAAPAAAAAAGLGKLAAIAGPVGIAVAAIGTVAAVAVVGLKMFGKMVEEEAKKLALYSGAVAGAVAETEIRELQATLRRTERIGPDVANWETMRGKFSERMMDVNTEILNVVLKFANHFEPVAENALAVLEMIAAAGQLYGNGIAAGLAAMTSTGSFLASIAANAKKLREMKEEERDRPGEMWGEFDQILTWGKAAPFRQPQNNAQNAPRRPLVPNIP
jgi:hypothetical protein